MTTTLDHILQTAHDGAPLTRREIRARIPARDLFPELEPADQVATAPVAEPEQEASVFTPGQDCDGTAARLTVYALNASVILFALPVGLALLALNIAGGENMRTTAHAMALTGLFVALGATEQGALLLSAI